MSPRLLGAAAVLVRSFARIHETNLKKQGVLPLTFENPADYDRVAEGDRISILGLADLAPGKPLRAVLHHADGRARTASRCAHAERRADRLVPRGIGAESAAEREGLAGSLVRPHARDRESAQRRRRHAAALAQARAARARGARAVEIEHTQGARDAERLAREAVRAGIERVVVAGGDGTLAEVATGLLRAQLGHYAELAVLPMGTGCDFARTLGIPRDAIAALEVLRTGKARRIDAGHARYTSKSGAPADSYFVNAASFGVSSLVVELAQRTSRPLGGTLAFALATVRALLQYQSAPVALRVDGSSRVMAGTRWSRPRTAGISAAACRSPRTRASTMAFSTSSASRARAACASSPSCPSCIAARCSAIRS
jgi:hypothetical protein